MTITRESASAFLLTLGVVSRTEADQFLESLRHPAKPPHEQWMHAGKAKSAKKAKSDIARRFDAAKTGRSALDAAPADHRYGSKTGTVALTASQKRALNEYANDAQRINDQVRRQKMSTRVARTVRQIDSVMDQSKLTSDVVVWRGVTSAKGFVAGDFDSDLTGSKWTEQAFVSTTADRLVAEMFAGMLSTSEPVVLMRVLVPEGTGAVALSDVGVGGALGDQAELLVQRGVSMEIVADHGVSEHSQIPQGVRLVDVFAQPNES